MKRPLFSCVIPVKGERPYFDEALESLLSQGMGDDLEIIVLDGDEIGVEGSGRGRDCFSRKGRKERKGSRRGKREEKRVERTRRTKRTERTGRGDGSATERRGQNSDEGRMDRGRMGDGSATERRADGEDRGVHASAQDGGVREKIGRKDEKDGARRRSAEGKTRRRGAGRKGAGGEDGGYLKLYLKNTPYVWYNFSC